MPWGAIGSIGGALIGSVGSLIGGHQSSVNAEKLQQMNYQAQKEFAQNGIRWKVADAKAAGIHPLYALGASTASYSPVSGYTGDNGVSEAANQFGQGISRAVQARMTREEREREQARQEMQDVFQLARWQQEQRKGDAEIRLIDSEIARNKVASNLAVLQALKLPATPSSSSPTLMPGQGDAPPAPTKSSPPIKGNVPSGSPMYQFVETTVPGVYTMTAGSDWTQIFDDKGMPFEQWPLLKTMAVDYGSRLTGRVINGMVYSNALGGWVRVSSPEGKDALTDPFGIRSVSTPLKRALNPRRKQTKEEFSRDYIRGFYTY